jgi:L-methionine (R)-S-oxide reductase
MNGEEICMKLNKLKDNGASLEELLMSSVEYLHHSNERFHWTGIYELTSGNILHLGPFIGEPTDHVFIGVGHGVCGSAIADKCNKNIPDVTKESNYLACSSSTKSELVVLIRKGDKIFAQIDIDSHDFNAFDRDAVEQVEKVSNWLAEVYMIHENSEA